MLKDVKGCLEGQVERRKRPVLSGRGETNATNECRAGGEQASESTAAALTVGFIHWPLPYTRDSLLLYK
jgi:hypothetical protein